MELFLLLAVALTIVSFISIALTEPQPPNSNSSSEQAPNQVFLSEQNLRAPEPVDWLHLNEELFGDNSSDANLTFGKVFIAHPTKESEEIPMPVAGTTMR